jgi:hypothetical protein
MLIAPDIIERMVTLGDEYAKAKAIAWTAAENIKRMKAKLMRKSTAKSVSEREQEALASDEYWEYVTAAIAAGEQEDYKKVRHDAVKAEFELLRTNASTERAANR